MRKGTRIRVSVGPDEREPIGVHALPLDDGLLERDWLRRRGLREARGFTPVGLLSRRGGARYQVGVAGLAVVQRLDYLDDSTRASPVFARCYTAPPAAFTVLRSSR